MMIGCGLSPSSSPAAGSPTRPAYEAVTLTTDRRDRRDTAIIEMASDSSYPPLVRRLCRLRGISTLTEASWSVIQI